MEETFTSCAFTLIDALNLRGTKPAYLLRVTISMQNGDIFAKAMHVQYLWYAGPKIM
jgi:hypothetical protein